jgi:hypothetical protein
MIYLVSFSSLSVSSTSSLLSKQPMVPNKYVNGHEKKIEKRVKTMNSGTS